MRFTDVMKSNATQKITPPRIRIATRRYYENLVALNQGQITPDQHRAENREIKNTLGSDSEWSVVKIAALVQFDR